MTDLPSVVADLRTEGEALDALVGALSPDRWSTPTPSAGWTIAHQIGHLAWTDRAALLSVTDPEAFADLVVVAQADPAGFVDAGAAEWANRPPSELLADWRTGRDLLASALGGVPAGTALPWYGPPMSAMSMATARLMETWAHGLDVAAALGMETGPTARLRSIAHLGVRTRDFAFGVHGRTPPDDEFRVDLTAPDGANWGWGPLDARQRVTGSAFDFCLLVTQRSHRDDLDLAAVGADADAWLDIAQAFAGPPGPGRGRRAER